MLLVERIESVPPSAPLIGIGPSIPEPLQIARQLRATGTQALLVFFPASRAARESLQAQLVRDPFAYPRFEIVELPENNTRQLVARISKVLSTVKRQFHPPRIGLRGRPRKRPQLTARAERSAAALLAHVLVHSRDAIIATDEAGRVTAWNDAAERMFGTTVEQVSGRRLEETGASQVAPIVNQALSNADAEQKLIAALGPGKQPVELICRARLMRGPRGQVLGVCLIARDDSDYQRVQAALRESNRQKDEFLAIMSHELRTPLTSILGYTDMLLRGLAGPLAPATRRYISNVRSAGDRLLELVNGLLDYTRLEAGLERLELRELDLGALIAHAVELCRAAAEVKHVDVHVAIPRAFNAVVVADTERIMHVLRALLSNAIKFTAEGGWIKIDVGPDPSNGESVRVSVRDSGIGMQPDQIGRVWERFYQADASLTRAYGGIGLGLSIARHLVTLHGGTVGAESSGPGLGSTFWFALPSRRAR